MLSEQEQKEILNLIETEGSISEKQSHVFIGDKSLIHTVTNMSSGKRRLNPSFIKKAVMIMSQPQDLKSYSNLAIRCCICGKTISYPCWYVHIKYVVNQFHWFICFQTTSPNKPSVCL